MSELNQIIANTFNELANYLQSGDNCKKSKIILSGIGSELGEENVFNAGVQVSKFYDITYIGTMKSDSMHCVYADCEKTAQDVLEDLLKTADAAITMHHSFPIGVSTVGKLQAPANGKAYFLATTTGSSATNRVEAMIKNAISGIIVAKASGISKPSLGIINIEGARQCELLLKSLSTNGYDINFASSSRADGGAVMRGNDLLKASADVVVCDSLTGNIIMKTISAFNSGGDIETTGWGYGPGIGLGIEKPIFIVSRLSGTSVIANAIAYAADLSNGNVNKIIKDEYDKAKKAGLEDIIKSISKQQLPAQEVKIPEKEVLNAEISGIDVMEIEDAVKAIWLSGIYAQSGMGCTGPIIMINENKLSKAKEVLKQKSYI